MRRAPLFGLLISLAATIATARCGGGGGANRSAPAVPLAPAAPLAPDGAERTTDAVTQTTGIQRLRRYEVDSRKVFIAGISSGGFFGVQMHVAYSHTFKGAAIYAGGVYHCANDSVELALTQCGGIGLYQSTLAASEAYLDQQSAAGTIDNERNLREQRVYLWSGTQDALVKQQEMNDLQAEYQHFGADVVKYDNAFAAAHGWESPDGELACGTQASPYMIPYNPQGCWDWWGYDDPNYALKRGTQASIVHKMVQRVTER